MTLPFPTQSPLRVAPLSSGSKGNAWVIEGGGVRVLMDDGLPLRELAARLHAVGLTLDALDAVVFTHHHHDHIAGAGPLLRKRKLPFHCSESAWRGGLKKEAGIGEPALMRGGEPFAVGGLTVEPVVVPHDAEETFALRFSAGGASFAYASDLGHPARPVLERLRGATLLAWEFNHDEELLANYPGYPEPLKNRIAGPYGHLGNGQAAAGLRELLTAEVKHLWLVHLSEKTNRPSLVLASARESLSGAGCAPRHEVAEQHAPGSWAAAE